MDSPSIVSVEATPKHRLPTQRHRAVKAEPKAPKWVEPAEELDFSPTPFQKIVAELMGTYILIFIGCGSAMVNKVANLTIVGIAIVWGFVLMAMIYALGHISGAHFNPAVTIAFAAAQKFPWKHVPFYVLSQLLGATLASLTLRVLFNEEEDSIVATMTQYKDPTTDLEAIIWEFIATFILMFSICGAASDHRASKDLAGLAIGGTLLVDVMIAGPITGASMNPARSIGPAVAAGVYKNLWVYVVAPIAGALAATLVYSALRVPEKQPERPEERTRSVYNDLYSHGDP